MLRPCPGTRTGALSFQQASIQQYAQPSGTNPNPCSRTLLNNNACTTRTDMTSKPPSQSPRIFLHKDDCSDLQTHARGCSPIQRLRRPPNQCWRTLLRKQVSTITSGTTSRPMPKNTPAQRTSKQSPSQCSQKHLTPSPNRWPRIFHHNEDCSDLQAQCWRTLLYNDQERSKLLLS